MTATTNNTAAKFSKMVTDGRVSFRNLVINPDTFGFKMEFAFVEGRKKKFEYQEVTGHVTKELYDWFTKVFVMNNHESDVSGKKTTTAFKLFLERKGLDFKPGILKDLEFTCDNRSQDFDDCPFRLTISPEYGTATLNLVYKFPKIVKNTRLDMET